jgi:hypothetical protein
LEEVQRSPHLFTRQRNRLSMDDSTTDNIIQDQSSTDVLKEFDLQAKHCPNMVHLDLPNPTSKTLTPLTSLRSCTESRSLSRDAALARPSELLLLTPKPKDASFSLLGYFSSQTSQIPSSAVPPRSSSKSKLPRRSTRSLPSSDTIEPREVSLTRLNLHPIKL